MYFSPSLTLSLVRAPTLALNTLFNGISKNSCSDTQLNTSKKLFKNHIIHWETLDTITGRRSERRRKKIFCSIRTFVFSSVINTIILFIVIVIIIIVIVLCLIDSDFFFNNYLHNHHHHRQEYSSLKQTWGNLQYYSTIDLLKF